MSNDAPNEVSVAGQDNSGTNKVTLSDHRGMVVLHFDHKVNYVALPPEQARQLAEACARQAYRAHYGTFPVLNDGSQITEQKRVRARNRVSMMLIRYNPKTDAERLAQAAAIVDEIMKIVI